jgi:DNA-directed RNA polymerase subunit omega
LKGKTIDSKFRFVIVAAQRAKQLLKGERPKIKSKHRDPIRIAQEEVKSGVIKYEILPFKEEGFEEEEILVAEAIPYVSGESEPEAEIESKEPEEVEAEGELEEEVEKVEEELEVDEEEGELEEEDE